MKKKDMSFKQKMFYVAISTLLLGGITSVALHNQYAKSQNKAQKNQDSPKTSEVQKSEILRYVNTQYPNELLFKIGNKYFRATYEKDAKYSDKLDDMADIETIGNMGGWGSLQEAFAPVHGNQIRLPKPGDPLYRVQEITNPVEIQSAESMITSGSYTQFSDYKTLNDLVN